MTTSVRPNCRSVLAIGALALSACGGEPSDPTPRPASLAVTPDSIDLFPGEDTLLAVVVLDDGGVVLTGHQIFWTSADPDIALVDDAGRVIAHAPGVTTITASTGSVTGTASVRVHNAPTNPIVANIELSAPVDSALPGETLQITAVARDQSGAEVTGVPLDWSSNDPAVADVGTSGAVQIVGPGVSLITASVGSVSAGFLVWGMTPIHTAELQPAAVEMARDGQIQVLERFRDAAARLIEYRKVAWVSDAPTIAAVDAAGLVTGKMSGEGIITATTVYEGRQVSSVVTVRTFDLSTVAAGASHACALTVAGELACWGSGLSGRLGNDVVLALGPVRGRASATFRTIDAGAAHSCALTTTGSPYCWGDNIHGQLRTGNTEHFSSSPAPVVDGWLFDSLAVGGNFACGLTSGGEVACWGADGPQLGRGEATAPFGPASVSGVLEFTNVSAGGSHACAVAVGGEAYCWGTNEEGRVGDGTTQSRSQPVEVAGGLTFTSLTAGFFHTCGLTSSGVIYCWGGNSDGVLGRGTTPGDGTTPGAVDVSGVTFTSVAAGGYHTCGIASGRSVYCWGLNNYGQAGMAPAGSVWTPQAIGRQADALTLGAFFTCATDAGVVTCWGRNEAGQLGAGVAGSELGAEYTPTPLVVAGQP